MDGTIGQIMLFAGNFAPKGWHFCDGSLLQVSQNEVLFVVIGTLYGGDGRKNYALPNLPPLPNTIDKDSPIRYIICVEGIFPDRP